MISHFSLFSFWVVISPQRGAAVVLEVPPGGDGFFFFFWWWRCTEGTCGARVAQVRLAQIAAKHRAPKFLTSDLKSMQKWRNKLFLKTKRD